MTIASAIATKQQQVADSYTAVSNKGGTLPATQNLSNLPTAISSIPSGGSSTKYGMSMNGLLGDIDNNGKLLQPSENTNLVFSGVTGLSNYSLYYRFFKNPSIVTVSFPDLTGGFGISAMTAAFQGCTNLTSVDLSKLSGTNSNNSFLDGTFADCTNLTTVNLSSLSYIDLNSAGAFDGCSSLTSLNLPKLNSINANMSAICRNCTSLTSINFPKLTTLGVMANLSSAFSGCTSLTSVDFPLLSSFGAANTAKNMAYAFQGCTNLTTVSFPKVSSIRGNQAFQYAFQNCTNLTSINFSKLKTIGDNKSSSDAAHFSYAFQNCTNLTTLSFPELTTIYCTGTTTQGTFYSNSYIQKLYFPKLSVITYGNGASSSNQNACKNIFSSCSSLTELHFGSANQSAIQATTGYSTAWGRGAGNVTIYFDL